MKAKIIDSKRFLFRSRHKLLSVANKRAESQGARQQAWTQADFLKNATTKRLN